MPKTGTKSPAKPSKKKEEVAQGKEEVVRDGYSMPKSDHDLIETIRGRCWDLKPNKSEVLRAGLKALNDMEDDELNEAVTKVKRLKPGKDPKKQQVK